jgi:aspartate-semialdehyde dehydrogenase
MREITVAVVGATGAVGRTMLNVLEKRNFPANIVKLFASEKSAGKTVIFKGKPLIVEPIVPGCFEGVDIGLFSAGGAVSEVVAPQAVREGAVVIDNTAAFRYVDGVPLVVPEVNPERAFEHKGIIANPNCSTIQLMVALKPLHDAAGLKRIIVSTYQSVSGAGAKGIDELMAATRAVLDGEKPVNKVFAHPIAFNALPHIDRFLDGGWTKEEMKMVWETHKIMENDAIGVTATCVRVPVVGGHSESVYAEFSGEMNAARAREIWSSAPGVQVMDDVANNVYPLATIAAGTDATYVGRIRNDHVTANAIDFWCVSDNLLKGAALNAVQIAELLISRP